MSARGDIWAVVPVKPFHLAKQRLAPMFRPEFRRLLAEAMLADVLDVLAGVPALAGIVVASADERAARLARARGAKVSAEPTGGGLNGAVDRALRQLAAEERGGAVVVAADLPAMTGDEVAALLDVHRQGSGLTIVPARDGVGTNAIALSPPGLMPVAFGENSFARHYSLAREAGVTPRVLHLPGIGLDIDRPEDVARFRRKPSATRTWRWLSAGVSPLPHWRNDAEEEVTAHVR